MKKILICKHCCLDHNDVSLILQYELLIGTACSQLLSVELNCVYINVLIIPSCVVVNDTYYVDKNTQLICFYI